MSSKSTDLKHYNSIISEYISNEVIENKEGDKIIKLLIKSIFVDKCHENYLKIWYVWLEIKMKAEMKWRPPGEQPNV